MITTEQIVQLLNNIHDKDPWILPLLLSRYPINSTLLKSPLSLIVDGNQKLGMLGILNCLCIEAEDKVVAAHYEDGSGKLLYFSPSPADIFSLVDYSKE